MAFEEGGYICGHQWHGFHNVIYIIGYAFLLVTFVVPRNALGRFLQEVVFLIGVILLTVWSCYSCYPDAAIYNLIYSVMTLALVLYHAWTARSFALGWDAIDESTFQNVAVARRVSRYNWSRILAAGSPTKIVLHPGVTHVSSVGRLDLIVQGSAQVTYKGETHIFGTWYWIDVRPLYGFVDNDRPTVTAHSMQPGDPDTMIYSFDGIALKKISEHDEEIRWALSDIFGAHMAKRIHEVIGTDN